MKSKLFFLLLLLVQISVKSQNLNQTKFDSKANQLILIGYCDKTGLLSGEFGRDFALEYNIYTVNQEYISKLKGLIDGITITIFLGTWCSDSKVQVPRFYKILDELKFDTQNKITLICVDTDKTAPGVSAADLSLRLVPTFIFYRYDKEIGRIIEKPFTSLEEDMLKILNR